MDQKSPGVCQGSNTGKLPDVLATMSWYGVITSNATGASTAPGMSGCVGVRIVYVASFNQVCLKAYDREFLQFHLLTFHDVLVSVCSLLCYGAFRVLPYEFKRQGYARVRQTVTCLAELANGVPQVVREAGEPKQGWPLVAFAE